MNARPGRGTRRMWLLLALLTLALPLPIHAQVITGHLRDAASRAPVEGALVLLFDVAGRRAGGVLTDARGAFGIVAPGQGRYTLRAERIGYATVTSEPFTLAADEVHPVALLAAAMPVSLEGIEVEGSKRCVVRPEEGAALTRVWGEAQKALRNQAWTDEAGWAHFRLRRYEREYDAGMRVVISERRVSDGWTSGNPIRSLPASDLLDNGFVRRTDDGGYEYFGPDASVLLSDAFLDTHCFSLAASDDAPGLVGLAFEPIRGRKVPDISGTFWLDRSDARLRFLEFVYTSSPWPEAAKVAAGRVEFDQLPGGPWVVRRWWIRMPRMERDVSLMVGGRSGLRVAGILEVGGTATQISVARAPGRSGPTGSIAGVVWDSTRGRPLRGAEVTFSGGGNTTVTDSAGRFVLEGPAEGVVELTFHHPRLDSLPMAPTPRAVHLGGEDATDVVLAVPSFPSMLALACGDRERPDGTAVLMGHVVHADTGEPLAGVQVTVEWSEYDVIASSQVRRYTRGLRMGTDARGRWVACGIPPGVRASARASAGRVEGPSRSTTVPRDGLVVLELTLRPHSPAADTLR